MFDENANSPMALVNPFLNVKDSRWLQVEVCREFQRGQCSRTDQECKFAHPAPHVEINNGRVTACYDSIKGRCTRENPKCKYLHPPQHIKDQLLINGRNNLALKNLLVQQLQNAAATSPLAPGQLVTPGLAAMPAAAGGAGALGIPGVAAYTPYYPATALNTAAYSNLLPVSAASPDSLQSLQNMAGLQLPAGTATSPATLAAATAAAQQAQQKARTDRVEAFQQQQQAQQGAGLAPKRVAVEKSGVPVYQPTLPPGTAYQYPAQLTMVPGIGAAYMPAVSFAGQPPNLPRL